MLINNLIIWKIRAYVVFMKSEKTSKYLWEGYEIPLSIKVEIESLKVMRIGELRAKYFELYGYQTNSRNREFLERKNAWKIQALHFGDISQELRNSAHKIASMTALSSRKIHQKKGVSLESLDKIVNVNLSRDSRLPLPGAILSKIHNGKQLNVKVLDNGFEFENKKYKSLSAIAREVMGSNWNGYKFFGL